MFHPVAKVRYKTGDKVTFALLREPHRRHFDEAALMFTKRGECPIELGEKPDFAGRGTQNMSP